MHGAVGIQARAGASTAAKVPATCPNTDSCLYRTQPQAIRPTNPSHCPTMPSATGLSTSVCLVCTRLQSLVSCWTRLTELYSGSCSWRGHVNRVPGGGLVGIGAFNLDFLVRAHSYSPHATWERSRAVQSTGFEEFRRHVEPLLENSRAIYSQFLALSAPSVLMVPAKVVDPDAPPQRIAYFAPEDPMTLFLITDTSSDKSHSN